MSSSCIWGRPRLFSGKLRGQRVCPLPWKEGQDSLLGSMAQKGGGPFGEEWSSRLFGEQAPGIALAVDFILKCSVTVIS